MQLIRDVLVCVTLPGPVLHPLRGGVISIPFGERESVEGSTAKHIAMFFLMVRKVTFFRTSAKNFITHGRSVQNVLKTS